MKLACSLIILGMTLVVTANHIPYKEDQQKENTKYHRNRRQNQPGILPQEFSNINFDTYLGNPRVMKYQLRCVVYNGPCDRFGQYLKVWITTRCSSCNPTQKAQVAKLISTVQSNYPREWQDLVQKYSASASQQDIQGLHSDLGINVAGNGAPRPGANSQLTPAQQALIQQQQSRYRTNTAPGTNYAPRGQRASAESSYKPNAINQTSELNSSQYANYTPRGLKASNDSYKLNAFNHTAEFNSSQKSHENML